MADSRLPLTDRIKGERKVSASQPGGRQSGESPDAFRAFCLYRDAGPGKRSLAEVTRQVYQANRATGLTILGADEAPRRHHKSGKIGEWSRKYNWVERVRQWDELLDARLRQKQLDAIEKMAARHASQNEILLHDLMAPAQAFARALQDPNRAVVLDTASLPELFKMTAFSAIQVPRVQKAERISRGVKVLDTEPVSNPQSTQSPAEWRIRIHQPERKGDDIPTMGDDQAQEVEEWEEA